MRTPAYGSTTNDRGYMSDGRPRRHHGLQARQRAMDRKASGGAARRGALLTVSIDPKLTTASKLGVQLLLEELGAHLIEDDQNTRSARSSLGAAGTPVPMGERGGVSSCRMLLSHACTVRSASQQLGLRQPVQN